MSAPMAGHYLRHQSVCARAQQRWRSIQPTSSISAVNRPRSIVRSERFICHSEAEASGAESIAPRIAVAGDEVTVHYTVKDPDGNVLRSTKDGEETVSWQLGAGEVMGNPLFQGFDEAVLGLAVGDIAELEAKGGDWNRDLLFDVPHDHQEIERLQGRYKNQGGLSEGMVVELVNGQMAMVVRMDEDGVRLDANNMVAGKTLIIELEVASITAKDL